MNLNKSRACLFRAIIVSKVISKSPKVLQNISKQEQFLIDYYLMLLCGFECGDSCYSYVNKSNFLYLFLVAMTSRKCYLKGGG